VDEVDLLLVRLALVVLGDQHVAGVLRHGVDAERGDAEVVADRLPGGRPVLLDRRDLLDVGYVPVLRHGANLTQRLRKDDQSDARGARRSASSRFVSCRTQARCREPRPA
jgi:hypothetical protein